MVEEALEILARGLEVVDPLGGAVVRPEEVHAVWFTNQSGPTQSFRATGSLLGKYLIVLNPFALNFWKMSYVWSDVVSVYRSRILVCVDMYSLATVPGPVVFGNGTQRSFQSSHVSIVGAQDGQLRSRMR